MTDDINLLPCPFCGGTDIFTEPDERGSGGQWCSPIHVGCRSCKAEQRGDDVVFARANWNRRAAPVAQEPVLCIRKNASGQIYLTDANGEPFDVSRHVGAAFYASPVEDRPVEPLYTTPVAQEPVAEVLSSRKGNDTSTIDKAFPDGTKLYTDPAAAQPIDDTQFWTVSPKASRRDLVLQIVQMNHRITALREENRGLIRHLQGQREALRNYRKGGKSIEPVFTLDHVGSWYGDDSPAGCVLVGAWTGKSFPPQGAKFYLKEKSK